MALDLSFVMIKGDHLADLPDIFHRFAGLNLARRPSRSGGWSKTMAAIGWPRTPPYKAGFEPPARKAACFLNGYTVILDPEMDFASFVHDNCLAFAQALQSRVFGIICDDFEEAHAYFVSNGEVQRRCWVNAGKDLAEDDGQRIAEEPPAGQIDQAFLLEFMSRMGVGYATLQHATRFYVYEMDGTAWGSKHLGS